MPFSGRASYLGAILECLGIVTCDACQQFSPDFRQGFHRAAAEGIGLSRTIPSVKKL